MTYQLKFNFNIRYRLDNDPRIHTRTVDVQEYAAKRLSTIYLLAEAHAKLLANSYDLTVYGKSYSAVHMVEEEPNEDTTD